MLLSLIDSFKSLELNFVLYLNIFHHIGALLNDKTIIIGWVDLWIVMNLAHHKVGWHWLLTHVWCNLPLVTHGPHTSHAPISCNLGGVGMKAMSSFVFLWLPKFPSLSLSNVTNSMDLLSIISLTTLYNDVANSHSTCTVDAGPDRSVKNSTHGSWFYESSTRGSVACHLLNWVTPKWHHKPMGWGVLYISLETLKNIWTHE